MELESGTATVRAEREVPPQVAVEAVRGKVILPWARAFLARIPLLGRR